MYHFYYFAVYVLFLIVNTCANYLLGNYTSVDDDARASLSLRGYQLIAVLLFMNTMFSIYLMILMWKNFNFFFKSYISYVDMLTYLLIYIGCGYRIADRQESYRAASVMSIATVLLFFKVTYFLRPYKETGHLIGMIEAILWDIKWYILILTVVVYGFSQAIFLSSWSEPGVDFAFDGPGDAMAQSLVYLVGNPTFPPFGTSGVSAKVSTFLSILLTVIGSIILLNLLIAIMNSSYTRIYERSEAEWVKQICITITEQTPIFPVLFRTEGDKFIHYLRRKVDVEKETEG
jgi:hypothetical protein